MECLLTSEQKSVFKETFLLFAHSDHHGREEVDVNEFITTLKCLGIQEKQDYLIKIFEEADDNKDGKINFDAFLKIMNAKMQPTNKKEKLWLSFRIFDKDGDGFISFDDLRNIMLNLGENLADEDINQMMRLGISNDDDKISYEIFQKIIQEK